MSNPTGKNQYSKNSGVRSAISKDKAYLGSVTKLSKTPMPGARGYFMASKSRVSELRSGLAKTIKQLRKS